MKDPLVGSHAAVPTAVPVVRAQVVSQQPAELQSFWHFGGGLFDCMDNGEICCLGCFCPCYLFGKLLQQYEPQINQVTEQVTKHATTFVSDVKEGGREFARDNSSRIISGASNAFTNLTSQPTPAKAD